MISEEYRRLNEELHTRSPEYGSRGDKWAYFVANMAVTKDLRSVLDYGCGKAPIGLPGCFGVTGYDPARPQYSNRPDPADLVVCTDVLEHIEPEYLDAVLDDLRKLTGAVLFATVATRPSGKTLADGRDAHLIVEPLGWWCDKLKDYFDLDDVILSSEPRYWQLRRCAIPKNIPSEFLVVAGPKC